MKVVAFQSPKQILVSMSLVELSELTGYIGISFNKAFGVDTYYGSETKDIGEQTKLIAVQDYPVSTIYKEARETLLAYEDLRGKFESIRNQLNVLMQKMVAAKPDKSAQENTKERG